MLRNPGAAASARATGVVVGVSAASFASSAASAEAIAIGAIRYGRASLIARLLAKSPCSGSAGRSTSTLGRSSSASPGSAPASIARDQARSIASRTRRRNVGVDTVDGLQGFGQERWSAMVDGRVLGHSYQASRTGLVRWCNGFRNPWWGPVWSSDVYGEQRTGPGTTDVQFFRGSIGEELHWGASPASFVIIQARGPPIALGEKHMNDSSRRRVRLARRLSWLVVASMTITALAPVSTFAINGTQSRSERRSPAIRRRQSNLRGRPVLRAEDLAAE